LTIYFADTSALAKCYLHEIGSHWMRSITHPDNGNAVVISELTPIEYFALLARRVRDKSLTEINARILEQAFLQNYQQHYASIELRNTILAEARQLVTRYPLRPPDAIQLACAIDTRAIINSPIIFLCSDVDLLSAARAEGFIVDDPNLHS